MVESDNSDRLAYEHESNEMVKKIEFKFQAEGKSNHGMLDYL